MNIFQKVQEELRNGVWVHPDYKNPEHRVRVDIHQQQDGRYKAYITTPKINLVYEDSRLTHVSSFSGFIEDLSFWVVDKCKLRVDE